MDMKESLEIRINLKYADLLFAPGEGKEIFNMVKLVQVDRDDPRYDRIPEVAKMVREKHNQAFFFGWAIKRKYSAKEWNEASLIHVMITTGFEPAGEDCGTLYDESTACEICGANRTQTGPLILDSGSIPHKDIAWTIAGEVVVSEKLVRVFEERGLKGVVFEPVFTGKVTSKYYQPIPTIKLDLTANTVTGINPFDFSTTSMGEVYKCPRGHTLGLNILSEPHVLKSTDIAKGDFFESNQKIGVKRGLLRPPPIYLCSPAFRKMVEEEKLTGFAFEIARVEEG
jgi:hypothetical protein